VPDVGGLNHPFTTQPFRFAAFQQLMTQKNGWPELAAPSELAAPRCDLHQKMTGWKSNKGWVAPK
jgi:hypothetical protein